MESKDVVPGEILEVTIAPNNNRIALYEVMGVSQGFVTLRSITSGRYIHKNIDSICKRCKIASKASRILYGR